MGNIVEQEKKETLDKLTKLKLKIPDFPYERTKNKNLKKRGEKNRKFICNFQLGFCAILRGFFPLLLRR